MAKYQNGMNKVYSPPEREDATSPIANIVFVHGLLGHPWKTWANESVKDSKKPFWPEDFLPKVAPNARIFSFGYDADVERFMSAVSLNTVHQHGRNLLNDLCDLIDEDATNIPFIFIVHSLGGLVLKEALNQSSGTINSRRKRVVELTHGIIFLGTPHKGSSVASYGKIAALVMQIFARQSANVQLLRALERSSETLDRINTLFHETLNKHKGMLLFSFYEEKETRKAMFGTRIVPPDCARIADEEWGGIPENHRYMAKFKSEFDPGFVKISSLVKRWLAVIQEAIENLLLKGCQECLDSLNNPTARARIHQVPQRHKDSFEWLFSDHVGFSRWLRDDRRDVIPKLSPIFWITGKPGSGKSTLMRFAMQDPRTLSLLPDGSGKPVAYFFHLRGKSHVQKSLHGMLLEITYQILAQFPQFYLIIRDIYQHILRASSNKEAGWDTESLKQCVLKIPAFLISQSQDLIMKKGERTRMILFIDALDENEDQADNAEIVSIIKQIAEEYSAYRPENHTSILKICLASRPWPIFQKLLGDEDRILRFAIHDHTKDDIRLYCMSRLSSAMSGRGAYKGQLQYWVDTTTDKARGVFIWVRIVVDYLCRNIIDGTPHSKLQEYFDSLPDELNQLYEHTLARVPREYALETLVSLRILLASQSPLTLETLYCATITCVFGVYGHHYLTVEEELLPWLRSRTGGLIELAMSDTADSEPTVQFIHQTTQGFLLRGVLGLNLMARDKHWLHLDGNFYIYKAIAASHPPHTSLLCLAENIFAYLKAIDFIAENDVGRSAMSTVLSVWTDGSLSNNDFKQIYDFSTSKSQKPGLCLDAVALTRTYIRPENRDIFTSLVQEITSLVSGRSTLTIPSIDKKSDYSAVKLKSDEAQAYMNRLPGSIASSLALILHGVYSANSLWEVGAYQEGALLLVAALGPRFTTEEVDRPRLVQKLFEKSLKGEANFVLDILAPLPNLLYELRGERLLFAALQERTNIVSALVLCEGHPHVSEDTRFDILRGLLSKMQSKTQPIPPRLMRFEVDDFKMTLMDYCARFKGRRWVELLMQFSDQASPLPITKYVPLKAALGAVAIPVRNICSDFSADISPVAINRYGEEGYLIPGLVGGLVAHPSLYKGVCDYGTTLSYSRARNWDMKSSSTSSQVTRLEDEPDDRRLQHARFSRRELK